MQKAPILKGSGLKPLEETKSTEEVHVFGKNLEERVITHKEDDKSSQVTFSTSQLNRDQSEDDIESIKKRKFDAITGEEDEETVFQGDFKLFVWDKESTNWMEKGRGQLKLNDSIEDQSKKSRLIMRISGTLRIILNVSIKQSTFKIIASSKTNIRITDSLTVWAVSGNNVQQLKNLLEERLVNSSHGADDTNEEEPTKKPKPDSFAEAKTPEDTNSKESTNSEDTNDDEHSPRSETVEVRVEVLEEKVIAKTPQEEKEGERAKEKEAEYDSRKEEEKKVEDEVEEDSHEKNGAEENAHKER